LRVEQRDQSVLEVRALDGGHHRLLLGSPAKIPRRLQQMVGVVGGGRPAEEHVVVGRALGFGAQATYHPPDEGMGPIERAGQMAEHLRGPVLAPHVGQLMEQEGATAILWPLRRAGRHHDRGTAEAVHDRNSDGIAHQETDAALQSQRASGLDRARLANPTR
jgi:hypothetical protein